MHMSTVTRLKTIVVKHLASMVDAEGFHYARGDDGFYRDTLSIRQFFHLTFIRHAAELVLVADVSACHNAIANLVEQLSGTLDRPEGTYIACIGSELGNLADGKQ